MAKPNRYRFILLVVFTAVLGFGAPALAQSSKQQDEVVRFTRTLNQVAGKKGVAVTLQKSPKASSWQVRLVDRNAGEAVGVATLPEWVGAAYYGYDVVVRGFGKVVVVIFEATPAPDSDAPPAAESFQVAWAYGVKAGEKKPVWQQIASTKNSPLDGGERLVVRREGRKDQLVRQRASEETRFCGADLASYQTFVPEQMAFRSQLDLKTLSATATPVTAALLDEAFVPSIYKRFYLWYSATSDRYNPDDSRTVIRPIELGDRNVRTAWVEGAAGLGEGEYVTARVNDALKTRAIRIFPGHGANEQEYTTFGTPKKLLLTVSDGNRYVVDVPATPWRVAADRGGLIVEFPTPVRTRCLTVVLMEAREGERPEDPRDAWKTTSVAISEISVMSELFGLAPDVAAAVVGKKLLKEEDRGLSRRLVQLTAPLGMQLVSVLQDVLRSGSDEDKVRVIPLLRSLPADSSVPILVDMFVRSAPEERAYGLVKPVLSAHGDKAATALLAYLIDDPPEDERKYIDLTRMIGRLGSAKTLHALIERLGDGSDRVRMERVRAVSRGGEKLLPELLRVARQRINTPQGDDALQALTSIGRKVHFRGQGEREGTSVLLEIAEKGERRRTRLLAVRGLGYFATPGALEYLGPKSAESSDPLLRRQAVESLARYPQREARIALEAALFDDSPDVRIAAIDGLESRKDRRQALASVQRYVDRERWKPGLALAYTIMAELGDDSLLNQMEAEIARAPGSERAAVIAESLERAKRPISANLAGDLILNPATTLSMRRDLVDLLGLDATPRGEEVLLSLVRSEEPFKDLTARQNVRLRNRAYLALGRRDSDNGRAELLGVVRDGPSNEEKSVALRALAFSSDVRLIEELRVLRTSAPDDLKEDFDSAIDLIDRRADIEEMREGIDETLAEPEADVDSSK